jgi:hypothetical protein
VMLWYQQSAKYPRGRLEAFEALGIFASIRPFA